MTTPIASMEDIEARLALSYFGDEFNCSLCDGQIKGFGNNPYPLGEEGDRCCDICNVSKVIPARYASIKKKLEDDIKDLKEKAIEDGLEQRIAILSEVGSGEKFIEFIKTNPTIMIPHYTSDDEESEPAPKSKDALKKLLEPYAVKKVTFDLEPEPEEEEDEWEDVYNRPAPFRMFISPDNEDLAHLAVGIFYQTYGGGPEGGYVRMPDETLHLVERTWGVPFTIKETILPKEYVWESRPADEAIGRPYFQIKITTA